MNIAGLVNQSVQRIRGISMQSEAFSPWFDESYPKISVEDKCRSFALPDGNSAGRRFLRFRHRHWFLPPRRQRVANELKKSTIIGRWIRSTYLNFDKRRNFPCRSHRHFERNTKDRWRSTLDFDKSFQQQRSTDREENSFRWKHRDRSLRTDSTVNIRDRIDWPNVCLDIEEFRFRWGYNLKASNGRDDFTWFEPMVTRNVSNDERNGLQVTDNRDETQTQSEHVAIANWNESSCRFVHWTKASDRSRRFERCRCCSKSTETNFPITRDKKKSTKCIFLLWWIDLEQRHWFLVERHLIGRLATPVLGGVDHQPQHLCDATLIVKAKRFLFEWIKIGCSISNVFSSVLLGLIWAERSVTPPVHLQECHHPPWPQEPNGKICVNKLANTKMKSKRN